MLFVFSFTVFHCYFLAQISLALRRIPNEDRGDRGKVFACVIRMVYVTPGFSVAKRILKTEAYLYFLV